MPVTIIPASHEPKALPSVKPATDPLDLLHFSCSDTFVPDKTRIVAAASCYSSGALEKQNVYPSSSSFVRSAIEAWGRHSHLVIRPEDLWFTILVQVNFYMEKNAEAVRHLFVSHAGQEHIHIESYTWERVIAKFRQALHEKVKTEWLKEWISPAFSTSTPDDELTATVLLMGLMKKYFTYSGGIICGIPSITLLGTKSDWQRLFDKIDRLADFGKQPAEYGRRLRPILSRIVDSFDAPDASSTRDFWNQMVQAKVKHSPDCHLPEKLYMVSGWILGFYYWEDTGEPDKSLLMLENHWESNPESVLEYDGVKYRECALEHIPVGYAKAKFTMVNEHGGPEDQFNGWVLAGNVGKLITDGAPDEYRQAKARVTPAEDKVTPPKDKGMSFFLRLKCGLNCFGAEPGPQGGAECTDEKVDASAGAQAGEHVGHTIQPLSGWFLFGPDHNVGPFCEGEEIHGPSVDAIDSCDGVEHYMITGRAKASKYDVATGRVID